MTNIEPGTACIAINGINKIITIENIRAILERDSFIPPESKIAIKNYLYQCQDTFQPLINKATKALIDPQKTSEFTQYLPSFMHEHAEELLEIIAGTLKNK